MSPRKKMNLENAINLETNVNMEEMNMENNNVIVVTGTSAIELPLSDTNSEVENLVAEETAVQNDIISQLQEIGDSLEDDETVEANTYTYDTKKETVRTLVNKYKSGKLKLPICQRLYVWNEDKRMQLLDSIKQNLPFGAITIAEHDGEYYLLDGLQRTVSAMLLLGDKNLTQEEKDDVLKYNVVEIIVYNMNVGAMKNYFARLNSGIALANFVKYRSKLSNALNDAILELASDPFFREMDTTQTFNVHHHHEVIASHILLAAAGIETGSNKAKDVCTRLEKNEEAVLGNFEKAKKVLEKLKEIYGYVKVGLKKSFNSNFLSCLVYLLAQNMDEDDKYFVETIEYIFPGRRAISEYSSTTSGGATDAAKFKKRIGVIEKIFNTLKENEECFKNIESVKSYVGNPVKTKDGEMVVDIEDFDSADVIALRNLKKEAENGKMNWKEWDKIVKKAYEKLENE